MRITVKKMPNGWHLAKAQNGLHATGKDVPSAIGSLFMQYPTAFQVVIVLDNNAPVPDETPITKRSKELEK